jgi:Flp pilus assembly protein TadD
MILGKIVFILINTLYGCTAKGSIDDIINCINQISSPLDIKENYIIECSSSVRDEKWYGYLCLCRINNIKGNFELARKMCMKAKEKNPFSEDVSYEIAYLYMRNNYIDEALIEANFAYSISTQNIRTNMLLAEIFEKKGILDKAYFHYENSLRLIKKDPLKVIGKKTLIENKIKELKDKIEYQKKQKKDEIYKNCIDEYRKIKENALALEKLKECFRIKENKDPNLNLEYLNLLYANGKYEEFIQKAEILLNKVPNTTKKEDIYLKLAKAYRSIHNNKKSIHYYRKIINTIDTNELANYAEILEEENDNITAIEIYKKIYSKTGDKKVYEKIEELETSTKSNEEILEELKKRGFVEKEKTILLPKDRKNFLSVKYLEKKGAVEWVEKNYPGYANLITTINNKEVLMLNGYILFLRKISQDMIRILEKNNIFPHSIFKMVDENGNQIFDEKGNMTYEGIIAYYKTKETLQKTWFYKTEIDAKKSEKTTTDTEIEKTVKNLVKSGYEEITEDEYGFLQKKTTCPDDILLSYPCNIKKIKYQNKYKYFICSSLKCVEDAFYTPIKLFSYIVSYREGSLKDDEDAMSNFFGTGARKKRFCENGKIWKGPEFSDESKRNEELQKELEMIRKHREKMLKVIENYASKNKK